jgi:hypothetical protein
MTVPSNSNPAGITSFDHRALVELPEYTVLSDAIDSLAEAVVAARRGISQQAWLTTVRDMAAALGFLDRCPECLDSLVAPYIATVEGVQARGVYRCGRCAHTWTCNWATYAPVLDMDAFGGAGEESQDDVA